mgnify:CR=1 FL=1
MPHGNLTASCQFNNAFPLALDGIINKVIPPIPRGMSDSSRNLNGEARVSRRLRVKQDSRWFRIDVGQAELGQAERGQAELGEAGFLRAG